MLYNIFKKFNISDILVEKFMKIYGMLRFAQSIGKKKAKHAGVNLDERGPQNLFSLRSSRLPDNLG